MSMQENGDADIPHRELGRHFNPVTFLKVRDEIQQEEAGVVASLRRNDSMIPECDGSGVLMKLVDRVYDLQMNPPPIRTAATPAGRRVPRSAPIAFFPNRGNVSPRLTWRDEWRRAVIAVRHEIPLEDDHRLAQSQLG